MGMLQQNEEFKAKEMTLQEKISALEQDNARLKSQLQSQSQNSNGLGSGMNSVNSMQSYEQSLVMSNIMNTQNNNTHVRKQRDPTMSLINPRRAKKRRTGFQFAGA